MGRRYIADTVEDTLKPPGEFPLPGFKHILDHGPLEVILGAEADGGCYPHLACREKIGALPKHVVL